MHEALKEAKKYVALMINNLQDVDAYLTKELEREVELYDEEFVADRLDCLSGVVCYMTAKMLDEAR